MLDDGAPRKLQLVQGVEEPEVLAVCSCEVLYLHGASKKKKIPHNLCLELLMGGGGTHVSHRRKGHCLKSKPWTDGAVTASSGSLFQIGIVRMKNENLYELRDAWMGW